MFISCRERKCHVKETISISGVRDNKHLIENEGKKTVILHFLPRFNNLYIAKHKSLLVRVCPKTVACRFWYIVDITIQCNAVLLAWVAKLVKYWKMTKVGKFEDLCCIDIYLPSMKECENKLFGIEIKPLIIPLLPSVRWTH